MPPSWLTGPQEAAVGKLRLRAQHSPMQIPALPNEFLAHSKLSFFSSYLGDKAPFLPGSCGMMLWLFSGRF